MEVDDEIVAGSPKPENQAGDIHGRPSWSDPKTASIKGNDGGEGGMRANELAILRSDEPIDARPWKAAAQFDEDGHRMDDITQGGGFDQKNPGEIGVAKTGRQAAKVCTSERASKPKKRRRS